MSSIDFNLREAEYERLRAILDKLQKELRAEVILLISRSGQPVVTLGTVRNMDYTALASLAAANLAATDGLANIVGESDFAVLVHQGRRRSLYISDLLKRFSLVVVFDASASLGLVRYKCKRVIVLLEDVVRSFQRRMHRAASAPEQPVFSDEEVEQLLGNIGP